MKYSKEFLPKKADKQFTWLTRVHGVRWEAWRQVAATYLQQQTHGLHDRMLALTCWFEKFLIAGDLSDDPQWVLMRTSAIPEFFGVCPKSAKGVSYNNRVHEFLQWLLETEYSEPDDRGRPVVLPTHHNPLMVRSRGKHSVVPSESVRAPLPYGYVAELREILAPGPTFKDWIWAHTAIGDHNGVAADWFEVDPSEIDLADPDCVWRVRTPERDTGDGKGRRSVEVHEIWSPARSVALLVKLHLPLRTYQVRVLDSGEADTWRYETAESSPSVEGSANTPTVDRWQLNPSALAQGSERKPHRNGVFRRIIDPDSGVAHTGLFINTNKTADISKDAASKGYVIPWQHEEVLYWLERLRNWQEKYNPIEGPTPWSELDTRHTGTLKSDEQLEELAPTCFLFRDRSAGLSECHMPLTNRRMDRLWFELLQELETRCATRGELRGDGKPLRFVIPAEKISNRSTTEFPLHSLRVTLLTCLALDGGVPLPILSKLVAGHARLVMTLYYMKIGPARMTEVLDAARQRIEAGSDEGIRRFLAEASYDDLCARLAISNEEGFRAAVAMRPEDRTPAGWVLMALGWCLVGGNTSPGADNSARIPGCWNGGSKIVGNASNPSAISYGPVPGGAGNCVRCRWFATEPHFLDRLRAHFNNRSYHLTEAGKTSDEMESSLHLLRTERLACEASGKPFTRERDFLECERRYERSLAKVDQLGNDLMATFKLINRCLKVIEMAARGQQIVAAGSLQDLKAAFTTVRSELLQISGVLSDAEFYPDEDVGKTVLRRTQILDSALLRDGVQPVFMTLTEDQQLRVGNRFMERLSSVCGPTPLAGLTQVARVIEAGESLLSLGLEADEIADILKGELGRPVKRVELLESEASANLLGAVA